MSMALKENEELAQSLPCTAPDHLLHKTARELIRRFCSQWLDGNKLSVMELLHSPTYQNKFLQTGGFYSNAVQKTAMAQVAISKKPVQDRVKELYQIAEDLAKKTREENIEGTPPKIEDGKFSAFLKHLITDLKIEKERLDFLANKFITLHLGGCKDWEEKLARIMALLTPDLSEKEASFLDAFLADSLRGAAGLKGLMGEGDGALLTRLHEIIRLYKGVYENAGQPLATTLAERLLQLKLPQTQDVLRDRIVQTLNDGASLTKGSLMEELAALNDLVVALAHRGTVIGGEDVEVILEKRCAWLLTAEEMTNLLKPFDAREDRAKALINLCQSVKGRKNREFVLNYVDNLMNEWQEAEGGQRETPATLESIEALAHAHRLVSQSDMKSGPRDKLAEKIMALYQSAMKKAPLLDQAEKMPDIVDKTLRLLEICRSRSVLDQDLAKARQMTLAAVKSPGFLEGYIAKYAKDKAQQKLKLLELLKLLQEALLATDG